MPDTLVNVPLPANTWVDLYAATGIPVGVAISAENVGTSDVYLTVRATQPPIGFDAYSIVQRKTSVPYRNSTGDAGAWAYSPNCRGKLNVRVAL